MQTESCPKQVATKRTFTYDDGKLTGATEQSGKHSTLTHEFEYDDMGNRTIV